MRSAFVYNFLIEANIMASIAIILMIPLRKFFRKQLGNSAICFGWLLVAIRLLCPLSLVNPLIHEIRSPFASDVAIRPIAGQIKVRVSDALEGLSRVFWRADNQSAYEVTNRLQDGIENASASITLAKIWLVGVLLVIAWFLFCNIRFRMRLRADRIEPITGELKDQFDELCRQRKIRPVPVYFTDPLPSACLVGVFRPYIALPLSAAPQDVIHVLTHEICHIKNRDHLWGILRLLCCAIHWFNPLVWIAASMSRTDSELRCDDRVTQPMNQEERKSYASVLVLAAARRNAPGLGVLATGMTMTGKRLKTRVSTVMQNKKPLRWLTISFAILSSMCLIGAFATSETKEQLEMGVGWPVDEHTLAEALSSNRHINNENDAIAYARELCERYWVGDTEVVYTAGQNDDHSWYVLVNSESGNSTYFELFFLPNGSVGSLLQRIPDDRWVTDGQYVESQVLSADELNEVRAWAAEQIEFINPGISNLIRELNINYVRDVGDAKYVYLHADPQDSHYDYGLNFFVLISNDHTMTLLEYGMVGNG
ncbi:MAG: M56 family metallopeptidase [Acidaminococcaceae bacterium]|nr:M56 family metallopeptidase [Acidaminococcaceae bacterium]